MKKRIIAKIAVIACAALYATGWPRSAEVGEFPAGPIKTAVIAQTEARTEDKPQIRLSGDSPAHEIEVVAESEQPKTETTAKEKTESAPPSEPRSRTEPKTISTSNNPKPGTIAVINGNRCIWVPGFGWIEDNGGGSVGTVAGDMYENGNKIGSME